MNSRVDDVRPSTRPRRSTELPFDQVRPQGWLLRQLHLQADGQTGRLEDLWPDVGPDSGWLGGPGENWERGPYYLDGLLPLAHLLRDEKLLSRVKPWIEWMLASQDERGFFGPADNSDWWPRTIAVKVLVQHAEATDDERVLPFLLRWFRYQLSHLPAQPLQSWGRARGADAAWSVWWAHERSGQDWLLDLVDLLDEQTFDWDDYLGNRLITGPARVGSMANHGPNTAMGLKTGALKFLRDGDVAHRDTTERSFAALDRWHGQAHGWFSGDEWLGGREATAGIETCQVVEMMFTCEVLAQTYGAGTYGDRLESLAFNLLPAANDARMLAHQYHQQANQVQVSVARRPWTYSSEDANLFGFEPHFGCCTANLHQGWPKFARSLWVRDPDDALRVVAYAPVVLETSAGGSPARFDVQTDYPFQDTVRIGVDACGEFALRLRIPQWCTAAAVTVDGSPVELSGLADGYVEVRRDWSGVREIVLTFPMEPRVVRRERQSAAVSLGPLSMVHSPGENWVPVEGAAGLGEWEVHPRSNWNYALRDVQETSSWRVSRGELPAVPFSLHRGVSVRVPAARATQWFLDGAQSAPPPPSPVFEIGPDLTLDLVPYGCARLRVTEFPTTGAPTRGDAFE